MTVAPAALVQANTSRVRGQRSRTDLVTDALVVVAVLAVVVAPDLEGHG